MVPARGPWCVGFVFLIFEAHFLMEAEQGVNNHSLSTHDQCWESYFKSYALQYCVA